MNPSFSLENQLLITKFYTPVKSGCLISRPHLINLLNESLKYPLTLVSASAGFGKTTLLSVWSQSLPISNPRVAWVSLEKEDNELRLFWTYVLTALNRQQPECFTTLLTELQSPQFLSLKHVLTALINLLTERTDHFLLILDDYQMITELQVHTTLAYFIEHLPPQLRIIVATRTDPPLPLSLLRAQQQILEIRTDQLCCTVKETRAFFEEVMDIRLPDETIQQVRSRTEGWLVGLQLLGLSLSERIDPLSLLQEVSGDQHYILDYLTQEVLQRQPQEVQMFLLCTSILEQLNASLCDAVLEQHGSQQMLQWIERANLFVVSLDSKRQWYRYHALFAEALHSKLEQRYADMVSSLHYRASLWYAQHNHSSQAILHAFHAKEWHWMANLIEQKHLSLISLVWGAGKQALNQLQHLPADIMLYRPYLCLTCTEMLWTVAPHSLLLAWLDMAEIALTDSLKQCEMPANATHTTLTPQTQQEVANLFGEVLAFRAFLLSHTGDGQVTLALCRRVLDLISADNATVRVLVALSQLYIYYASSLNDATTAIESGLQAVLFAQKARFPVLAINMVVATARYMIGAGRLHEMKRLIQQAMPQEMQLGGPMLPEEGWITLFQAEILREWNDLDTARALAEEAIPLCQQSRALSSLVYILLGHMIMLRIALSRKKFDEAYSAFHLVEQIGERMNQQVYRYLYSLFTTIDQVRLWLACGELDRATCWVEGLDRVARHSNPYVQEREEVACTRVLLAERKPDHALQRLEPVLQRATAGKRWGHVIEMRLLQALAYQMDENETRALSALSEAICLAEPEGYICIFVDEGAAMEVLLYQLRKRERKDKPTPYLDTVLAAFQQRRRAGIQAEPIKNQWLPEPLSEREREVLELLARGLSNLEVAQELVITVDTVKRHASHVFSKLGVRNRMQAVLQARKLGLLAEEA